MTEEHNLKPRTNDALLKQMAEALEAIQDAAEHGYQNSTHVSAILKGIEVTAKNAIRQYKETL